jgi:hypothetical protein
VQRTASYLEVCVEPHVPGLKWETTNRHNPFDQSWVNRAIANAPFPTLFVVQALYGSTLLGVPLWLGIAGTAAVSMALGAFSIWTAKRGRAVERNGWQRVLQQRNEDVHQQTAVLTPIASVGVNPPTSPPERASTGAL